MTSVMDDDVDFNVTMSDFLGIGDYICLFCEDTEGFVHSWQSSSVHNGLYIYHQQSCKQPIGIPNPHVAVFQLCIRSRYKLNKKFRRLQEQGANTVDAKTALIHAKSAANAENEDNVHEQSRQQGKKVRYGDIVQGSDKCCHSWYPETVTVLVQRRHWTSLSITFLSGNPYTKMLKHVFTGKYIHVSTTRTSRRDKNNMMIALYEYNAKHAQFRILPRYKVRSEGEVVQLYDQVAFESLKSPGQFFHASTPHQVDPFSIGSELNLGVDLSGFTVTQYHRDKSEEDNYLRGGSAIKLFHKELEAYLVAEGLFEEELTEDVHLRLRRSHQGSGFVNTETTTTPCITYWQIEPENSILNGHVIRWESQIRLRHMTTRQYLCMDRDKRVCLTRDAEDPNTVFALHPVIKENDEITFESYARIEHVLSGFWLHALKDEEYHRKQLQGVEDDGSMKGLRWDGASLRQISASGERVYHDAYTLQCILPEDLAGFNYVAGMIPFLLDLHHELKEREHRKESSPPLELADEKKYEHSSRVLNVKKIKENRLALRELKNFIFVQGVPVKQRQKLMRNLRVVDLLVQLLKMSPGNESYNSIFKGSYEVLHSYMMGSSRKNSLYFAKYIDFFQTQFQAKGDIGLYVAQIIVELIRDNRKIVDRISKHQIDEFVELLRRNQNYRYLELLSVLCVCDGVAIQDNQTYITENWLMKPRSGVYLTELGQKIKKTHNIMYVSLDQGITWIKMQDLIRRGSDVFDVDKALFLEHQLNLYKNLCYGRNDFTINVISRELGYLTWEEAFSCLTQPLLPEALRAKYCDLVIGLFVDIGNNYSVLENSNISFVYEDIDARHPLSNMDLSGEMVVKDLLTIFPFLRDWINTFLAENGGMVASKVGHNMLIEQVLRLLHYLVKFGYYDNSHDIKELQQPLLALLDGRNDLPFQLDKGSNTKSANKLIEQFRKVDRYQVSMESTAIVHAKHQALEVLHLILACQFNTMLRSFTGMFKQAEIGSTPEDTPSILEPLMYDTFDPAKDKKSLKEQRKMHKALKDMFDHTSFFNADELTSVLLDLTEYKYDKMVTKSLGVLDEFFSLKMHLYKRAAEAQVLITPDSARAHREVLKCIPVLRRLTKAKLSDEQVITMSEILDSFTRMCHVPFDTEERHPMNQNILMNHDVLSLVFDNLSQEIDTKLIQYESVRTIVIKNITLLKALAKGNPVVQRRICDRMDKLLCIKVVESEIALALKEAFVGNEITCMKVQPRQIERIVDLVGYHREKVPELLDLLCSIVKVQGIDISLKRNQAYVMKFIMQSYSTAAYVFDKPREERENILLGQQGNDHKRFYACLVDLLSTCGEGENLLIESLCQTILPVDEILWVISNEEIDNNVKKPFLKYLHSVFMKSNSADSGVAELTEDSGLWTFIENLSKDILDVATFMNCRSDIAQELFKVPPRKGMPISKKDPEATVHANVHFLLEAVLPFLRTYFSRFYVADQGRQSKTRRHVNKLAKSLLLFCKAFKPYIASSKHLEVIMSAMTVLLPATTLKTKAIERFLTEYGDLKWFDEIQSGLLANHREYYAEELSLNTKFSVFATNCGRLYGGHNTISAQIKFSANWANKKEYTALASDEPLPLGEEFQEHIRSFLKPNEKRIRRRYAMAGKIIKQLGISSSNESPVDEAARLQQEVLDVKCLQLLRAMVYNEIVKLPDDWEEAPNKYRKYLNRIREIQNTMVALEVVPKVLPLLGRANDEIIRETLAFMCILLFNANRTMQEAMIKFFGGTREERFFLEVSNRIQMSTVAIKEKRALAAQKEAHGKDRIKQKKGLAEIVEAGKKTLQNLVTADQQLDIEEEADTSFNKERRKGKFGFFSWKRRKGKNKTTDNGLLSGRDARSDSTFSCGVPVEEEGIRRMSIIAETELSETDTLTTPEMGGNRLSSDMTDFRGSLLMPSDDDRSDVEDLEMDVFEGSPGTIVEPQVSKDEDDASESNKEEEVAETADDDMEYRDEGYIEMLLKLMALMCDGQFTPLQDYLREQPDNIKSFNMVADTTGFLNMVYSNITGKTIDLAIQLFSTLNEFCSGNQANRAVVVSRKVTDYINFILRAGEMEGCPPDKVLELRQTIGNLIISLIEENGHNELLVAKEVQDTIDIGALYRVMSTCYQLHKGNKPQKNWRGALSFAKTLATQNGKSKAEVKGDVPQPPKEALEELGYTYFFILHRFHDIDSQLISDEVVITSEQERAYKYYKRNCMSIEILKDNTLQKINFRVANRNVLREEVKEKLKWSVDRSSPSNKIRDLMQWSKDILKDIHYQKRILSNFVAAFLAKGWLIWSSLAIFLSLLINVVMLATWNAPLALGQFDVDNYTKLPDELFAAQPDTGDDEYYDVSIYILAIAHNVVSLLVLLSYFLSNHPQLPNFKQYVLNIKAMIVRKQEENDDDDDEEEPDSKFDVQFFSLKTFYYIVFLAFSFAGTLNHTYLFAFHLLNIVNNNQLLGGVIQAVTQNGKSLLWVGILGLVIFYLYAIVAFTAFRDLFDPDEFMYCATLWQCTITMIRYGLIGDYDEMRRHEKMNTFTNFGYLALFQISFFICITTIGLNIIFGIIVDTFSELRDLKWTAESDMRDTCFICSRKSYDFEHHAQGFIHHVKQEHNMWAYIFFMIHLDDTNKNNYTALELHVSNLLEDNRYDFFPLNRALALTSMDEDSTKSKIDEVLQYVISLVEKQKEEECERKRQEERMHQRRWQEMHRQQQRAIENDPNLALRDIVGRRAPDDGSDDIATSRL